MFHALTTLLSRNIFKVWIFAHLRYLSYSLSYTVALITSVIEHLNIGHFQFYRIAYSHCWPFFSLDLSFRLAYLGFCLYLSIYLYFIIFPSSLKPSHLCKIHRRIWYTFLFFRLKFVIFFFSIFLFHKEFSTSIINIFKIVYEFSDFITLRL